MIVQEEVYLAHYGVPGMKWGVRRQEYKSAKESFKRNTVEIVSRKNSQFNPITNERFKNLSDKDIVVRKGSEIKRITKDPAADFNKDRKFVSVNSQDASNYRAAISTWENRTGGVEKKLSGPALYETTFRATKDLKSPSERKRVEAYITLMNQKSIKLSDGKNVTGREYLEKQGLGDTIKGLSNKQVALQYYGQLVYQQGIPNEPINTAYFKQLSKKGYNAVVDDNDRGILASTPMLLLKSSRDLEQVNVQRLTISDVHRAQISLKLPDEVY